MKKVFISAFLLFCGQYVQAMVVHPGADTACAQFLNFNTLLTVTVIDERAHFDKNGIQGTHNLVEGACYLYRNFAMNGFLVVQVIKFLYEIHDGWDTSKRYSYTADGKNIHETDNIFFTKIPEDFSVKRVLKKDYKEEPFFVQDTWKVLQEREQKREKMFLNSKLIAAQSMRGKKCRNGSR